MIEEVAALVRELVGANIDIRHFDYGEVFLHATGLNPHSSDLVDLQKLAGQVANADFSKDGRSTCLELIFSLVVEPELPAGLVFVIDYPACQPALARLKKNKAGVLVARRFEAFFHGMELANGYYELSDPVEQRSRFQADNALREAIGKPCMEVDEYLLAAMDAGLPACAGVAMGVDRLLMQSLGLKDIGDVLAFPWKSGR